MVVFMTLSIGLTLGFAGGVLSQRRIRRVLVDKLHYAEVAVQGVGDICMDREVRRLRRRLAGLLASPGFYLRARRMLGPLELEMDELTAELELLETADALT